MTLHEFFPTSIPLAMSHSGDTSTGAKAGSFESYRLAWEKGFRCFQVDVVALHNGELLSDHAITGRKRSWEDKSVADLRASGVEITTVDEILDGLPDSRWNVEIKSMYATQALRDLLTRRPEPMSQFLISSPFRPAILRDLRKACGPDLAIAASLIDGGLLGFPLRPRAQRSNAVQLWKPLVRSQRILDRCAARGIHVQVWSVNKPEQIHRYLERGVPGIISDNHDGLRSCLEARSQWAQGGIDAGA